MIPQLVIKLDPKFKAKWVAALRSGKYKQGKGALQLKDGGFCCLGVACDLIAPNLWTVLRHDGKSGLPSFNIHKTLFGEQAAKLGIIPAVTINGNLQLLFKHNDSGATFEEIATAIEEQL